MADDLQFDSNELAELREFFFAQATEIIDSLGELILCVERDPTDAESLGVIRRAVHTLKGDSMAFGFRELTHLAHQYEDALDQLRAREGAASRELIDLLLSGSDALAALITYYRGAGELPDVTQLISGLAALHHEPESGTQAGAEGDESDNDRRLTGERRTGDDRRKGDGRRSQAPTLRVESERIDAAMNLVGELIIQRSMIATLTDELEQRGDERARQLAETLSLAGRTLSELQESVMRMRLVAIDQVFKRFPRVVRDAGLKLGKPLRLEIAGGQTEIDKSVVEVISDPLIHLIRNACDHGIEMPEVRRAAGKPEEGLIRLCARRAGNQIAVEVSDDGGGMDPARIIQKAAQKGLIKAPETAEWTDQQKISLIFLPGFSTRDQISDWSGRGVGMDVVKTTVDSLGGSITVSSVVGQGSKFTIKLPLTMAIVRAMLFQSCRRSFALPLDAIREITRLRSPEVKTIDGREVLRLREQVLPLLRVDEALGLRRAVERDPQARLFVFVVELGDGREVGLAVEELRGEQELVLKTVDDKLSHSAVVAGASILGDGSVVLILDPQALVNQMAARGPMRQAAPTGGAA